MSLSSPAQSVFHTLCLLCQKPIYTYARTDTLLLLCETSPKELKEKKEKKEAATEALGFI